MKTSAKAKAPPEDVVETFSDIVQGSPEWFELRRGIPTASVFSSVMAEGEGKMRKKLLYQLAGEILSKQPAETYQNDAMRRGNEMEQEALDHYAFVNSVEIECVGFVRRTIKSLYDYGPDRAIGCSPDGLIGKVGIIQIKTMKPDLIIELVNSGRFPSEHRAQVQGEMYVTGRLWCVLKVFYRGMDGPSFHVGRDEAYISRLKIELEKFDYDLRQMIADYKQKILR